MGRRYRLYPAVRQADRLTGWGHTSRAVWNVALAQRQFAWTQRSVTLRAVGQNRQLTQARAELPWLADLPAQSAQQVLRNLDAAYDNWWNPQHPAGSPKFKKRGTHLSVPFPGQSVAVRALNRRWGQVRLPKIGWIRFRLSRPFGGEIRNATVSRDALGWHVSLAWRPTSDPPWPTGYQDVGWTSGWLARRSSPMSRPHVACHRLSPPGSGGAYSASSAVRLASCVGRSGTTLAGTRNGSAAASTRSPSCGRGRRAAGRTSLISSRPTLPNATAGSGSRTCGLWP
jgi:hypothetical protein